MNGLLRSPFPYFGGKERIADEVWRRFGVVDGYVEPFAGSLAMALKNPHPEALKSENVNDIDGFVANFWRAVAQHPEEVARWADWPVSQVDLTARHRWLVGERERITERLVEDPAWCDPMVAGWWVWGIGQWIGGEWTSAPQWDARPHLADHGRGIHSLGQRPHLGDHGSGGFYDHFTALAARLRHTRVSSCDWSSLRSTLHGACRSWGVFLDPPYTAESGRDAKLYGTEDLSCGHAVAEWARSLESRPEVRVALCGILGEYEMPGWEVFDWKTGGYSYGDRDRREVVWFSPSCASTTLSLFGSLPRREATP